jgi:hypothetical protein
MRNVTLSGSESESMLLQDRVCEGWRWSYIEDLAGAALDLRALFIR